jgi:hypothetical protein
MAEVIDQEAAPLDSALEMPLQSSETARTPRKDPKTARLAVELRPDGFEARDSLAVAGN